MPSPSWGVTSQPTGTGRPARAVSPPGSTFTFVPLIVPGPSELPNATSRLGPCVPPGPTTSSVIPARSIPKFVGVSGSPDPGRAGLAPHVPIGKPRPGPPPTAANAMYSATNDRSGLLGSYVVLSDEFSSDAYPVVPGKNTPM